MKTWTAPYKWCGSNGIAFSEAIYQNTVTLDEQDGRLWVVQEYPRQTAGNQPIYDSQEDFDKDWQAV